MAPKSFACHVRHTKLVVAKLTMIELAMDLDGSSEYEVVATVSMLTTLADRDFRAL